MVGMAEMGHQLVWMRWQSIQIVGVSACVIFIFAPENPEDGKIYFLVPAQLGCPRQSPESCKMVVCVCVLMATDQKQQKSYGYVALSCKIDFQVKG